MNSLSIILLNNKKTLINTKFLEKNMALISKNFILRLYNELLFNEGILEKIKSECLYYRFKYPYNFLKSKKDYLVYLCPNDCYIDDPRFKNLLLGDDKNAYGKYIPPLRNDFIKKADESKSCFEKWISNDKEYGYFHLDLLREFLFYRFCVHFSQFSNMMRLKQKDIENYKEKVKKLFLWDYFIELHPAFRFISFFAESFQIIYNWAIKYPNLLNKLPNLQRIKKQDSKFEDYSLFNRIKKIFPLLITNKFVIFTKICTEKEINIIRKNPLKINWFSAIMEEFKQKNYTYKTNSEEDSLYKTMNLSFPKAVSFFFEDLYINTIIQNLLIK